MVTLDGYLSALRLVNLEQDIEVDGIDVICYCGMGLTDEGREKFKKALTLPMYEDKDGNIHPCVVSFDDADYEESNEESGLKLAWEMLKGMAGYCPSEDFDKWFVL